MEFNDFLNRYEKEALQVDLRTEYPLVFDVLERQKMKLNSVNFDSEIDEVIAFCKKAVNDMKVRLNLVILNEGYIANYVNGKPAFYSEIKTYFEYLQLYNKAIDKKQQLPPQQIITKNTDEVKTKKIPEKWHALLYWIELNANGQRPPINNEGGFIKSKIEKIGNEKTGTTGQSFYRQFIEIDLNNSKELIGMFGNDWKQKIIQLSNDNQKVIDYIELKYKL